ncbi:PD-(D/E)XK nuclease family protein [Xanthomarina spongicola]|uniref:PD-(D/E)XK nuclease superfamily protein n=1 Tax=Xanthomarina spongicola TaxID=570520 RepID=A0A316DQR0_9FLAO|nr:PD-(D/E)XK nuclease family protein [Xanthomarina spongicola]PWK20411.1 PD-(D/E)XK nuclease superfamily protein [Xanthomarina spongicola]
MKTFIYEVLKELQLRNENISNITFILPSKRAGVFLKHKITSVFNKTIFSPKILSIEEFTTELSQLKLISNTELLFEFYSVYLKLTDKSNQDNFETFSKWAQIIIQDFNEIDRYLIPQKQIFEYLNAIQELNHWSKQENKTDLVKNYLSFWNKLIDYYNHFTEHLIESNVGYQGLIYRESVSNIETYIQNNSDKKLVFLGFNALNTAEETIIQELLQNGIADIYWDIEKSFFENPIHDAGMFIRNYHKKWSYFKSNTFKWITNNYTQEKNISIYGVPKNIGQAKQIGSILKHLTKEQVNLSNTAIILSDETLLLPVLNSLPSNINALNITMGSPLSSIPLASLFEKLFYLHKTSNASFYYKDVISILSHQNISCLFDYNNKTKVSEIIETIQENNLVYLNINQLKALSNPFEEIIDLLFSSWENNAETALKQTQNLILKIKTCLDSNKQEHILSLEYLYRFNELFNEMIRLNTKYSHLKSINSLFEVYKNLLSTETLDFKGEPLEGLQVMGMLESRVLDFETVIISSVNEGVLPAGKSHNSFIPFDVKLQYNLPTFKEKDAVYSYHFYRLIQRAKNVHILYNTEADVLNGGEKSRFITQLELEDIHSITHKMVLPIVTNTNKQLSQVKKDDGVLKRLKEIAEKGFSPSSLTNYIRNPIDFYNQKILKIKEYDEVEETVAANTLGSVIHNTLEDLYKPLEGIFLTIDIINEMKPKINDRVIHHFKEIYKDGDLTKGKNLIVFEIAKRYLNNFLEIEIEELKNGNKIKIIAIESENKVLLKLDEIDFPVYLTGKVDRVDQLNGTTRIIDYKSGKVDNSKVSVINWEDITTDYIKFSKSFQVLTYAYAMVKEGKANLPLEAGIISFKNLSAGFLKFSKKESSHDRNKITLISEEILQEFEIELKKLIIEICNPEIDFIEKEI